MKQVITTFFAVAFALNVAQAQDKKPAEAAAVKAAKATVAADKANLQRNEEARAGDRKYDDQEGLRIDRKAHRKGEVKLAKDRVKKDAKVVKKAL
ncbi:hypothetical protein ACFQ48_14815 [Hymenobacter caeli]|uniref:Ni/Co efflux regulator RcnB n=1 Tax=Hymenobacter caeli TaxID=2735894 RepID=A0ABX2FTB0_9BACT|nr:hypothetical protein [Hymenobacter caeli]NRT19594.1 Ni/Co efflux regulator RcnB [Hymenobacter caeli]